MKRNSLPLKRRLGARIISTVAALTLCSSMISAPALAFAADGNLESLPSALDLRHYDGTYTYNEGDAQTAISGGINYVTPVKLQNPFGSCWSFAVCAASETSMLFALDAADDGEQNGSIDYEKAASGEHDLTALFASDLSERHLAYFAFANARAGEDSEQQAEGRYLATKPTTIENAADMINSGGATILGVSVFGNGIGPAPELFAPYTSDEHYVSTYELNEDKTECVAKFFTGSTQQEAWDAAIAFVASYWTGENFETLRDLIGQFGPASEAEARNYVKPALSDKGTWGVDSSLAIGTVAELSNSNIISDRKDETTGALTTESINLMKRELNEGHALSIGFAADQSKPGDEIGTDSSYLNTENWAQYTYEAIGANHAVTIVGYDDNYSALNFKHNIYKMDEVGELVVDGEATAKTIPAGNGAWIVKNSWGSTDAADEWNQSDWGIDGSGYFYLSYYDKTITTIESFEYDMSEEAQERTGYSVAQYDLSEGSNLLSQAMDGVYKMVNVFSSPNSEDGATTVERMRDISCLTGAPNDTVTLEVYVMDANANVTEVIDAGNPVATVTKTYDNAGFHRIHLSDPIVINSNQKVAVVQTTVRPDDQYECTLIYALNKTFVDAYNDIFSPLGQVGRDQYSVAYINEGESFEYSDGEWSDWKDASKPCDAALTQSVIAEVKESAALMYAREQQFREYAEMYEEALETIDDPEQRKPLEESLALMTQQADTFKSAAEKLENFSVESSIALDNWSIKLYADEALRGDVNGNGALNIVDAQIAYDIATGKITGGNNYAAMRAMADVDGDGYVAANDARAIQYAIHYGWKATATD